MPMTSTGRAATWWTVIALSTALAATRGDAQTAPSGTELLSERLAFGDDATSLVRMSDGECLHPADAVLTVTSPIFLVLEAAPTPYPLPPRTRLLFSYIAQDIAAGAAMLERTADGRVRLFSADSLYPPGVMLSRAAFGLRHDGSLANVDLSGIVHDGFRAALRARFDSIAARGGVGGFDARGLPPEIPLVLSLETKIDSVRGAAPLFALEIPIGRVATMRPGNPPPPYPEEARSRGMEATVLLTFVVDAEGRVREETIRTLPEGRPHTAHESMLFRAFERSARLAVRSYEYSPAEFLGCRKQMWVQQPFSFKLEP